MKGYRRYIAFVLLLFGVLVLLDYFRPNPVDWTRSFSNKDKIPFGTYALYELLPDIFENETVELVRQPVFNHLQDTTRTGNYIFISQSFMTDSLDTNLLLDFVARGNQVFIAAEWFTPNLADTLGFYTGILDDTNPDSTALSFTSPSLQKKYTYPPNNDIRYIELNDSVSYTPLGQNGAGMLNFMQLPFGEGSFYISTVPLAFTNYSLLTLNESEYAATALSYLPVQPVFWDEYQKQGRFENNSVFRVLMSHQSLKWAYYLALFTLLLFLLFKSKRTQRIIPVIEPPRNTTLDFVKVIGSLYYNHGNHKNIAQKKIAFFQEYLRTHYNISGNKWNNEMLERVVTKSGAEQGLVTTIFNLIESIRQSNNIGEQTLMILNVNLEEFYKQTKIRTLSRT